MIENVIHNSHNKNGITISVNGSVKNQENITCVKYVNVCVCVFVCVYVCVCMCVCVCVYFLPRQRLLLLNKTTNVMPKIRPAILCCGNDYVSSTFVATSQTIIAGTIKLATVQECQLNRTEPQEVKDNSKNFLKTNGKSAKHSHLTPH